MEKRAIIAVVLSIAVIMIFQMFLTPHLKQPANPTQTNKQEQKETPETATKPTETKQPEKAQSSKSSPTIKGKDIVIDTDVMKLVFTTAGARIKQWELKKYKIEDKPVELVTPHPDILPLSINFNGISDSNILYEAEESEGKVSFKGKTQNGINITKTFSFKKQQYYISLSISLTNALHGTNLTLSGIECVWGPNLGVIKKEEEIDSIEELKTLIGDSVVKDKMKSVKNTKAVHTGAISCTAMQAKKFIVAIISREAKIYSSSISYEKNLLEISALTSPFTLRPNESQEIELLVYGGPQTYEDLKAVGVQLEKLLQFGWIGGLGLLLLVTLNFLYKISRNYGIAIIFLTILVKIILWWPSQKSYKSMKAMQAVAPQIEALKQRYKNNPQQLNQETLKLYRENKVNPLGGCLPMILQIPIFFGLYSVLINAAELQGAPFAFWIKDLSKMDTYYVLPILMGITMFIQQKMTPSTDPNQAKIMLIMPVIFTFMFVSLPSGVVLYWTVQNILSIAQQYWIQKTPA